MEPKIEGISTIYLNFLCHSEGNDYSMNLQKSKISRFEGRKEPCLIKKIDQINSRITPINNLRFRIRYLHVNHCLADFPINRAKEVKWQG